MWSQITSFQYAHTFCIHRCALQYLSALGISVPKWNARRITDGHWIDKYTMGNHVGNLPLTSSFLWVSLFRQSLLVVRQPQDCSLVGAGNKKHAPLIFQPSHFSGWTHKAGSPWWNHTRQNGINSFILDHCSSRSLVSLIRDKEMQIIVEVRTNLCVCVRARAWEKKKREV